jgi:hypothetical protein
MTTDAEVRRVTSEMRFLPSWSLQSAGRDRQRSHASSPLISKQSEDPENNSMAGLPGDMYYCSVSFIINIAYLLESLPQWLLVGIIAMKETLRCCVT